MTHLPNRWFRLVLALLVALSLALLGGPASADKDDDGDGDKKGNKDNDVAAISEISDGRIAESSGLALSNQHNDLAYTMNDEGGAGANVYAIQVSTGEVVGAADISSLPISDPESITVDANGTVWLGDLGDNERQRDDVAIYAFPEPGPGETTVSTARRYAVTFPGGPLDVEGLLVHPVTNQVHLVSKNESGNGRVFELPSLQEGGTVQARDIGEAPGGVTDATYTHDGAWALLLSDKAIWIYNPTTWEAVGEVETPKLEQAESVTVERGDRTALVGSEGKNSPIVRVNLPGGADLTEPIDIGDSGGSGDGLPYVTRDMAVPVGLLAAALLVAGLIAARRLKI
ncbi:MAG TPA: hypothetical protein VJ782_09875 [Aeromicrobium sp.]|nr:hypothetical protein [Aeromicrobium sp.]